MDIFAGANQRDKRELKVIIKLYRERVGGQRDIRRVDVQDRAEVEEDDGLAS